jgi:acetyl esterase/lipase
MIDTSNKEIQSHYFIVVGAGAAGSVIAAELSESGAQVLFVESGGLDSGMPSTRVHVGDEEVLLDDSLRYVEPAVAGGVDARADVWMGMPHGFPGSIGRLKAAAQALDAIGAFLAERTQAHASP